MSRNDAAFYTDSYDCFAVWVSGDVKVYRAGEMRIHYTRPDGSVAVLRYTSDLDDVGIDSDDKLRAAEKDGIIEWIHNPWFEVVESDDDIVGEVELDYDGAVAIAMRLAKEKS